jgi:hypothetical protein
MTESQGQLGKGNSGFWLGLLTWLGEVSVCASDEQSRKHLSGVTTTFP